MKASNKSTIIDSSITTNLFNLAIDPSSIKLFEEININGNIETTTPPTNYATTDINATNEIIADTNNFVNIVADVEQQRRKSRSRQSSTSDSFKINKNAKTHLKVYKGKKKQTIINNTTLPLNDATNLNIIDDANIISPPLSDEQHYLLTTPNEQQMPIENESSFDQHNNRQTPSSTKVSREVKQLQKMVKESKVLTEFMNDSSSETKLRQKKTSKPVDDGNSSAAGYGLNGIMEKGPKRSRSFCLDVIIRRNAHLREQCDSESRRRQSETICRRYSSSSDSRLSKPAVLDMEHFGNSCDKNASNNEMEQMNCNKKRKRMASFGDSLIKVIFHTFLNIFC